MTTESDTMKALMAEARKRQPLIDRILYRVGYVDGWFVLKGEIVRRRPLRWVWQAKCAWLLHTKWNLSIGHADRSTVRQSWKYAQGLAEVLDEPGDGYLSPSEAIDADREYWES